MLILRFFHSIFVHSISVFRERRKTYGDISKKSTGEIDNEYIKDATIENAYFTYAVRRMSQAIKPIDANYDDDSERKKQIIQQSIEMGELQINSVEKSITWTTFWDIYKCLLSIIVTGLLLGLVNQPVVYGLNVANWVFVEQCSRIVITICVAMLSLGSFFNFAADHKCRPIVLSTNNVAIQLIIVLTITCLAWFVHRLILNYFTVTDWRYYYGDFLFALVMWILAAWSSYTINYVEIYKSDYVKKIYKDKQKDPPQGCQRFARSSMKSAVVVFGFAIANGILGGCAMLRSYTANGVGVQLLIVFGVVFADAVVSKLMKSVAVFLEFSPTVADAFLTFANAPMVLGQRLLISASSDILVVFGLSIAGGIVEFFLCCYNAWKQLKRLEAAMKVSEEAKKNFWKRRINM